jgi:hypothetical protein
MVANLLFGIHTRRTKDNLDLNLKIGSYLRQLANYRQEKDLAVFFDRGYIGDIVRLSAVHSSQEAGL